MNFNFTPNDELSQHFYQNIFNPSADSSLTRRYNETQHVPPGKRVSYSMGMCQQSGLDLPPSSSRPQYLHKGPAVPCQPQYGMVPVSPHTPLPQQQYGYFGLPSPYVSSGPEVPASSYHGLRFEEYPQQHHAAIPPQQTKMMTTASVQRSSSAIGKATAVETDSKPVIKQQATRYSFTTPNREKATTSQLNVDEKKDSEKKLPERPKMEPKQTIKVLSGPLDKVIKWGNMNDTSNFIFEVIGPLMSMRTGVYLSQKILLLKEMVGPALQCIYYEIDRPLPSLQQGQLVRCVGKMVGRNKMQVFSVRAASTAERSSIQRIGFICQRGL